jgi:phage terminase large subunit-like protein
MEILLVTVFVVEAETTKGKVTDCVPATAGAANVIVPLVSPDITIELIRESPIVNH